MGPLKLLLDTHVMLWWFEDSSKIKGSWLEAITEPHTTIYVSVVSLLEIVLKTRTGKLGVKLSDIQPLIDRNRFTRLSITIEHLAELERLTPHHRDPFDHLLIAQAISEDACLVSADAAIALYPVQQL